MKRTASVLLHSPEPGSGAGRYVYELTRALASEGWRATLLAPDNFEYRSSLERERGVIFSPLGTRDTETGRTFLSRTIDNLGFVLKACSRQWHNRSRSRVIHFQFPMHLPFGLVQFLLARLCGMRIVFTAHDPLPHKWLFRAPWNRLEWWSLGCVYGLSDRIIVHSEAGWNTLRKEFQIPVRKLAIIPHGPFSVPSTKQVELPGDRLNVLLFGALRENKGIHLAIEAVGNLAKQGLPIRLTIAGETPNGKEETYWSDCNRLLAQSAAQIELQKRYIGEHEIPGLLAQAHCVLLPYTTFTSDSGIAALALSNAKPIVATTSGGLDELLRAAELGITIAEPTVAGVEDALRRAWFAGPQELARLGRNGAHHVLENCSWRLAAQKTGALYQQLSAEGNRAA